MSKIRVATGAILRDFKHQILFNWILRFQSQPRAVSNKKTIVFAPHQDDETFGCGGTIALKHSQGVPVKVVFLTDGHLGRPEWVKPEEIIQLRQQEATNALSNLGIEASAISFVGEIDGSLSQLENVPRQKLIARLIEILQSFKPEEIYVPYNKDGHPDHEATYELVRSAIEQARIEAELLQYPIWAFWRKPSDSTLKKQDIANAYKVFIGSVRQQKKQAIENYKSQIRGLPGVLIDSCTCEYEIFFKS
jgi:N-acetylglucosamine malate deacetylase 1